MTNSQQPGSTPSSPAISQPSLAATPSLMRRMACWLYEGTLLFGVIFIAGYLFSALTQQRHALAGRHALMAFLFLILGIYFTWFWSKGQTLAMKTWHIQVTDRQGQRLSQPRALLRYVLSWLWFLPPLALIAPFHLGAGETSVLMIGWVLVWALLARFHPRRQFWHDALAGTLLLDARPRDKQP